MTTFQKADAAIIDFARKASIPFARFGLFLVFFWFGILKIIGTSPANELVKELLEKTLPFVTFEQFIIVFAIYEMIIGILFLIPRCNRLAVVLLAPHMVMTIMPLFLLPAMAWTGFLTPSLEGQYMIKNIIIIGLALCVVAQLKPRKSDQIA